jgi:hypothetical protein
VAEFLSDEWVAQLDAAARSGPGLASDPPLVVETLVRAPGGDTGYQVHLSPGGASVTKAGAATPDVVLVTDRATAWALHRGDVRAQDAFARGDLKVRGRPELLSGRADVFAALERAVAPVRAGTPATADR